MLRASADHFLTDLQVREEHRAWLEEGKGTGEIQEASERSERERGGREHGAVEGREGDVWLGLLCGYVRTRVHRDAEGEGVQLGACVGYTADWAPVFIRSLGWNAITVEQAVRMMFRA